MRVAINGFGRIGRLTAKYLLESDKVELVAINDLADTRTLTHLFKYDSVHGNFLGEVTDRDKSMYLDGKVIYCYAEKEPENLPWKDLEVDIVLECTGLFRTEESCSKHLMAGARRVIISAPAKGGNVKSIVPGVNDEILNGDEKILSCASCTTNCVAPMVMLLNELCEIQDGFITTIHSYTGDQRLHDSPHRDLRRARAAAQNIVPTTTGAAKAIGKIFPQLHGKLEGSGIRVPVINGSLTELICNVANPKEEEEINQFFEDAAGGKLNGILQVSDDPIVSSDIIGNRHSCVFDPELTVVQGNSVKLIGWYDNEAGYSARLAELSEKIASF